MTFVGTIRTPDVFAQHEAVEWWMAPSDFALVVTLAGATATAELSRPGVVRWGDSSAEQPVAATTPTTHEFAPGSYVVKATDAEGTTRSELVSVARPA